MILQKELKSGTCTDNLNLTVIMACNGVLNPPAKVPPQTGKPQVLNFFTPSPPPVLKPFTPPLRLDGYFQQEHVYLSEAIITD